MTTPTVNIGFNRLSFKLTVLLACVLTTVLAGFAYLVISMWQSSNLDAAVADTERFSDTIKRSAEYSMLHAQSEAVHEIINTIGKQQDVEWVRVFNKEGRVSYSTTAAEIGSVLDKNAEACYLCHREQAPLERLASSERSRVLNLRGDHRVVATINPIYNSLSCSSAACHVHPKEQQVLGVLDVAVSLKRTDAIIRAGTYTIAAAGTATIAAVCLLVAFFLQRYVGWPVKKLLKGTQKVASGDFGYVITPVGNDEIARLACSFNSMTESLRDKDTELRHLTATLEQRVADKTKELQHAQMQVIRAEKLASVGQMAAGVAHELNNPLTGVLTYAHLLARKAPKESQERADLDIIISETNRCSKIIKDLLQFSRETPCDKKPSDINDIIRQVLRILERQLSVQDVQIQLQLAEVPAVVVDTPQMKQVLMNIIINGAQAMPRGGILTIATSVCRTTLESADRGPQDAVAVAISDSGTGISPENLQRLFEPFFTTKDPGKGTGLGLSVSLRLVELHGGTITAQSEPGRGATFTVLLPLAGQGAVDKV